MSSANVHNHANEIWGIADILRGSFKPTEYGRVILPFLVFRRLDCVLADTKDAVVAKADKIRGYKLAEDDRDLVLKETAGNGLPFYNTSPYDFAGLLADPDNLETNLLNYLAGYSRDVQDIAENFQFADTIRKLTKTGLLYAIVEKFAGLDLHPSKVSNTDMGYTFEEVLRRFSEMVNETAGEHYTPREVVHLAARLAIAEDPRLEERRGDVISIYDPTCGTGGMLTAGEELLAGLYPEQRSLIRLYGQELNDESYAIAKADLMIKGYEAGNIRLGNTLTGDQFPGETFRYSLANPPYGVSWATDASAIKDESEARGFSGRFGAGTPPVSDGSLLFVQHLVSKMPEDGGRAAIVLNSSPLTNGDAGNGESNIRKWLLDNDLVDAIVGLPPDMFYNTGIGTYIWVLDNNKIDSRRGLVRLIDARGLSSKLRKSLGQKRNEMQLADIDEVMRLYRTETDLAGEANLRVVPKEEFYFHKIVVERPKRDEAGEIVTKKGSPVADPALRDTERVPYGQDVQQYLESEVLPWYADAWIDTPKTKLGVQIPFEQHFYEHTNLPAAEDLRAALLASQDRLQSLVSRLFEGENN